MTTETTGKRRSSKKLAVFCICCFLFAGLFLLLLTTLAGPSFGYSVCAVLIVGSSFAWYRPRNGASFSFPLVFVFVYWFVALQVWRLPDERDKVAVTMTVVALLFMVCAVIFVRMGIAWKPLSISVALVVASFAADRQFTNRLEVRTVEMSWSSDGKTPWADETQLDSKGRTPVIVYTQVDGGYCYDAIFSEPLKQKLLQVASSKTAVQYNEFKDFGSERGYNIRSIAGMQFNNDHRALIADSAGYGGTALEPSDDGRKYVSPTCPR